MNCNAYYSIGKLAGIDRADVGAYRNSYKHNLSLEILQEGYVSSFIELFELFDQQASDRESAGQFLTSHRTYR